jgi:hypothetical protein
MSVPLFLGFLYGAVAVAAVVTVVRAWRRSRAPFPPREASDDPTARPPDRGVRDAIAADAYRRGV